jgi:hypothetical protein
MRTTLNIDEDVGVAAREMVAGKPRQTGPALLRRAEPPLLKLLTRVHDVRVA